MSWKLKQDQGIAGWLVSQMIRRTVRSRFRNVYWDCSNLSELRANLPVILIPNHHGWHDGYLMYLAVKKLGLVTVDWIEEFAAFPLFRAIGGLPFPPHDAKLRVQTIRTTVERMKLGANLLLFAEGKLHPPPDILPIPLKFERLVSILPAQMIILVSIHYEMALHERPEAYIRFSAPMEASTNSESIRNELGLQLTQLREDVRSGVDFEVLFQGTHDVNERWGLNRKNKDRSS